MIVRSAVVFACVAFAGCATVAPDPKLITWGIPEPKPVAQLHADRIWGIALTMLPTGSMEPFITGGDGMVGDFQQNFADMEPGWLVLYDANWTDPDQPLTVHMAQQKRADGTWVMNGIANTHYETGALALRAEDYRARVVAVYTSRPKP